MFAGTEDAQADIRERESAVRETENARELISSIERGKMELSEVQKIVIEALKICRMETEDILAILLMVQKEENLLDLAHYLKTILKAPPDRGEIMKKAAKFRD